MRYLQVIVEVPDDVTIAEAREYIQSELKAAGGCRRPDDPLFSGLQTVNIKSVRLDARATKRWERYSNVSD